MGLRPACVCLDNWHKSLDGGKEMCAVFFLDLRKWATVAEAGGNTSFPSGR